jgi:site-specific recombinase XerD
MRFLLEYYPQLLPGAITDKHITAYMCYVKDVLLCGRDKCRGAAAAFSFTWKHVFKTPFDLPTKLYPKKAYRLPEVMTETEVGTLISTLTNLKSKTILSLFYATGIRVNEAVHIKLCDIDRSRMRIRITHGKGNKERFAILSPLLLTTLEAYYRQYKPSDYLFNGSTKGNAMGCRSMQLIMETAVKTSGLKTGYSLHTLRHSFATHLLNAGCNIHTIKELLGHSHLQTTMVYLHLQNHVMQQIISPFDRLKLQP